MWHLVMLLLVGEGVEAGSQPQQGHNILLGRITDLTSWPTTSYICSQSGVILRPCESG